MELKGKKDEFSGLPTSSVEMEKDAIPLADSTLKVRWKNKE
jgi:hypothetical protein